MKKELKWIIAVLVFALFVGGAYLLYDKLGEKFAPDRLAESTPSEDAPNEDAPPEETEKAPDFTVYDREGNEVTLYNMRGKPTVVNFWASWCPPCKEELPDFEKMYLEMGDEINFMMVDMTDGYQETREKGENYIKEQGFTFPLYFDLDQDAAYTYGIQSLPTTVFYDKEGNMITYAMGMIDYETLLKGIGMITE